jgi:nitrogen regulatory protein PII
MKRIEAIIRPAKLQRSAPLFEGLDQCGVTATAYPDFSITKSRRLERS